MGIVSQEVVHFIPTELDHILYLLLFYVNVYILSILCNSLVLFVFVFLFPRFHASQTIKWSLPSHNILLRISLLQGCGSLNRD